MTKHHLTTPPPNSYKKDLIISKNKIYVKFDNTAIVEGIVVRVFVFEGDQYLRIALRTKLINGAYSSYVTIKMKSGISIPEKHTAVGQRIKIFGTLLSKEIDESVKYMLKKTDGDFSIIPNPILKKRVRRLSTYILADTYMPVDKSEESAMSNLITIEGKINDAWEIENEQYIRIETFEVVDNENFRSNFFTVKIKNNDKINNAKSRKGKTINIHGSLYSLDAEESLLSSLKKALVKTDSLTKEVLKIQLSRPVIHIQANIYSILKVNLKEAQTKTDEDNKKVVMAKKRYANI